MLGEKEDWKKCVGEKCGKRSLNIGILTKGNMVRHSKQRQGD